MYGIKTENLTKKYKDVTAVDALDLEVNSGEIFALLGVNGAGKTTTVKMLSCLTKPDDGDAFVLGASVINEREKVKSVIGVSPQETAVAPNLTVKENLELIAGIYCFTREKTEETIKRTEERFDLTSIMNKRACKLSGGWQRRLSIAMALVSEPKILFLDEPTLGLDIIARSELWDTLRMLKGNTTVILTTHYLEEAEALSDRIGIMKDGRLIAVGTANELKAAANKDRFDDAFVEIIKNGGTK